MPPSSQAENFFDGGPCGARVEDLWYKHSSAMAQRSHWHPKHILINFQTWSRTSPSYVGLETVVPDDLIRFPKKPRYRIGCPSWAIGTWLTFKRIDNFSLLTKSTRVYSPRKYNKTTSDSESKGGSSKKVFGDKPYNDFLSLFSKIFLDDHILFPENNAFWPLCGTSRALPRGVANIFRYVVMQTLQGSIRLASITKPHQIQKVIYGCLRKFLKISLMELLGPFVRHTRKMAGWNKAYFQKLS